MANKADLDWTPPMRGLAFGLGEALRLPGAMASTTLSGFLYFNDALGSAEDNRIIQDGFFGWRFAWAVILIVFIRRIASIQEKASASVAVRGGFTLDWVSCCHDAPAGAAVRLRCFLRSLMAGRTLPMTWPTRG